MGVFFLLVTVAVIVSAVWLARGIMRRWDITDGTPTPGAPAPFVPLDDAPPGVLDEIVARLRRPDPA
jgi:hypothetical protein